MRRFMQNRNERKTSSRLKKTTTARWCQLNFDSAKEKKGLDEEEKHNSR